MSGKLFFVLLLSVQCMNGIGQDNFRVALITGTGYYSRSGQKIPLKIGTPLLAEDNITLMPGSEVTLGCANYTFVSLQAGNNKKDFSVKTYIEACSAKNSSLTKTYVKSIVSQLFKSSELVNGNEDKEMKNSGAVIRDIGSPFDLAYRKIPDLIKYYKNDFYIQWPATDSLVKSEWELFTKEDSLPFLTFPLLHPFSMRELRQKLPAGTGKIYWTIKSGNEEFESKKTIEFITDEAYANISAQISIPQGSTLAERAFVSGYSLELNHLYGEAYLNFRKATALKLQDALLEKCRADLEHLFVFKPTTTAKPKQ